MAYIIGQWGLSEVHSWMTGNGLGEEAETLRSEEVDGAELLNLSFEELTEGFGFSRQSAMNLLVRKEFAIRTILDEDEPCCVESEPSEPRHSEQAYSEQPNSSSKLQHQRRHSIASSLNDSSDKGSDTEEHIDIGVLCYRKST